MTVELIWCANKGIFYFTSNHGMCDHRNQMKFLFCNSGLGDGSSP